MSTITNSRRILLVGSKSSGKLTFLKCTSPSPIFILTSLINPSTNRLPSPLLSTSHAGLSHEITIKTQYYTSTIPIWIDELPSEDLEEWTTQYLSPAAAEVLEVLGGIILTFRNPPHEELAALKRVVEKMGRNWDGVLLAVSMGTGMGEEMEERCFGFGFEMVEFGGGKRGGRNELRSWRL
ncbi:hypothetical protein BDD12DRAFT_509770 [Trichophaea hybrida]|nr:hypothetical protein BDD12DRAFT_509770 [Trichophaea hybrida]